MSIIGIPFAATLQRVNSIKRLDVILENTVGSAYPELATVQRARDLCLAAVVDTFIALKDREQGDSQWQPLAA